MENTNSVKEYNTDVELLKDGSIVKVYGSKTFLNVAPVYNIDKVRFSIVDIGKAGKNAIDIYLNCEEVRRLVADIDSGKAKAKIDADKGDYPTAYSWTKGTGGSKRLVIGGGQKGVRVQASVTVDGNRQNKYAVIQFADLEKMAFMFKLTAGLIPMQDGSYYHGLYKAFKENESKFTNTYNAEADASYNQPIDDDAPISEAPPVETPSAGAEEFAIQTTGTINEKDQYLGIPVVITNTKENGILVFTKEQASGLSWFPAFRERIAGGHAVNMKVLAVKKSNNLLFQDVRK